MTMRMQLDVHAVASDFLDLTRIHQLQKSLRFDGRVIYLEEASEPCGQIVLLHSSHILFLCSVHQTADNFMAAEFSPQIQRFIESDFRAIRDYLALPPPKHVRTNQVEYGQLARCVIRSLIDGCREAIPL